MEKLRFCLEIIDFSPKGTGCIKSLCLLLKTEVGPEEKMQNIQSVNQDDPPGPTWTFADSLQVAARSKILYPGFQCNLNDLS